MSANTNIDNRCRVATSAAAIVPIKVKLFEIRDGVARINLVDWPFLLGESGAPTGELEVHVRRRGESRWIGAYSFTPIRQCSGRTVVMGAAHALPGFDDGNGSQTNPSRGQFKPSSPQGQGQNHELRRLALELTRVEQRERKRLAELLHDHLQQLLVAVGIRVHLIGRETTAPAAQKHAVEAQNVLKEAIKVTRTLAAELCPLVVTQLGLAESLKWLGDWVGQYHGLNVRVRARPEADPATHEVQIVLYQSVRELLFNAVKHARAHRAAVLQRRIDQSTGAIVVCDRGQGFEPSGVAAGMGLSMTRQRLEAIGGGLELRSVPGRGTRLEIRYPLT